MSARETQAEKWPSGPLTPVASHLGSDDETGARIAEILQTADIKSAQAGSLGYTTSVEEKDAERARAILRDAKVQEKLKLDVIDAGAATSGSASPEYLKRRTPQLFIQQGDRIEEAPDADHAVARRYPSYENKGPVADGMRVTLLSEKLVYHVNEPVRVIHVFEATEPGIDIHIMGPKIAYEEFVDGVLRTMKPPMAEYPWVGVYDGAVLPSPNVDYNYEISSYTFGEAGEHTIQWKPGELESNVLVIKIVKR